VTAEPALVTELRAQVAGQLAGHAGAGPLPVAQRRLLAERYTAQALDAHAQELIRRGQAPLPAAVEAEIAQGIVDHLAGAGGLQGLLDDPDVENIDLLTELSEESLQLSGRVGAWASTVPTHD
jgi:hypothetical protein